MKLCHLVVLPPPCQRPPGAEIPAMGFAATLKILVKANLLSSLETAQVGTLSASVQSASPLRVARRVLHDEVAEPILVRRVVGPLELPLFPKHLQALSIPKPGSNCHGARASSFALGKPRYAMHSSPT
jgi:hypothetical protein